MGRVWRGAAAVGRRLSCGDTPRRLGPRPGQEPRAPRAPAAGLRPRPAARWRPIPSPTHPDGPLLFSRWIVPLTARFPFYFVIFSSNFVSSIPFWKSASFRWFCDDCFVFRKCCGKAENSAFVAISLYGRVFCADAFLVVRDWFFPDVSGGRWTLVV